MGRKPKKKPEEMTELERLQAENAVLKNERTPIEGRKRARRKTKTAVEEKNKGGYGT